MSERVTVDIEDRVARVTLNRPDKRNALDIRMFEGIVAAAEKVAAADDVRAVVLTGAGSSFCAGLDLGSLMSSPDDIGALIERTPGSLTNLAQEVAWAWRRLRVPVIAAISGEAFGGGLQIALGADIRLVAENARYVCHGDTLGIDTRHGGYPYHEGSAAARCGEGTDDDRPNRRCSGGGGRWASRPGFAATRWQDASGDGR